MEATLSPSVPASAAMTPEEARSGLMALYKRFPGGFGTAGINPDGITFCACCGSQFLHADGTIHTQVNRMPVKDMRKHIDDYFLKYSKGDVEYSYSNWPENVREKCNRENKPGATIAIMGKEAALDLLYSNPEKRRLADGYEIDDKDQGHVVSVLWLNA